MEGQRHPVNKIRMRSKRRAMIVLKAEFRTTRMNEQAIKSVLCQQLFGLLLQRLDVLMKIECAGIRHAIQSVQSNWECELILTHQ